MLFIYLLSLLYFTQAFEIVDDMRLPGDIGVFTDYTAWPGGVVPYKISNSFTASARRTIENAVEELNQKLTGVITIVPRTNQYNYVNVIEDPGCWSFVGMVGRGPQDLSLGAGCVTNSITQHEFIHALGFLHTHQRNDRDDYVIINLENVVDGYQSAFRKERTDSSYGQPYDHRSVMHYSSRAFSKNGQYTIVPKGNHLGRLGNSVGATQNDLNRVTLKYGGTLTDQPTISPTPHPTGSPTTPVPTSSPTNCERPGPTIDLLRGPIKLLFLGGRSGATMGVYTGRTNKKFSSPKNWRHRQTISFFHNRGLLHVRAPGVRFKTRRRELFIARVNEDHIRIGDAVIKWKPGFVLNLKHAKKELPPQICRT
jgi:hypothetical protein